MLPNSMSIFESKKSQVNNSTYVLRQNKPKTNAKRISNCSCPCCSFLSLYYLLPATSTSTFVQPYCRKDQETYSVSICSLCTCTNTLDRKVKGRRKQRCPAQGQRCCSAVALTHPVLQLHLQQPAAHQGTENREWNHIYATWGENSTSFLRPWLPLPAGTGQGCVLGNLLQLTTIKCFSKFFWVYFVTLQNWNQTFATL